MATGINKIRNPDFSGGKTGPSGWVWKATAPGKRWKRCQDTDPEGTPTMTLVSDRSKGSAFWSQVVVCQPDKFYRIEAVVTCDLSPASENAGVVLAVQPEADGRPTGERRVTPGLRRASEPIELRTYYQTPEGVRRLKVSIGLEAATGTVYIRQVRFIRILEPDEESHILALPQPAFTLPPPLAVREVCVCASEATERPITRRLAVCFGQQRVQTAAPTRLRPRQLETDALLLPDPIPPSSIRSLSTLTALAQQHIVVISLPAFARLAGDALRLRRIEQEDDSIHACVVHANYATCGFVLNDTFAYAWSGQTPGSFVQHHFRKTTALKAFCVRHGFETLLESMCDRDATSSQPICLHKATARGGLFVLDIEPAEAEASTFGEPALAMQLLLTILGHAQPGLGQYVSPVRKESELRGLIREAAVRFEPLTVCDENVPNEEVTEQLVTIGREDAEYGLPLQPKPVILVRSGLVAGDVETVHGAMLWFKQLLRAQPHTCPYARQLAGQFRLAWVPCAAGWEPRDGWRRSGRPPLEPTVVETEDASLAAVVDLVSRPINRVRVVVPGERGLYPHLARWLPRLPGAFAPGRCFTFSPPDGGRFDDRDGFAWRHIRPEVQVAVEPEAFRGDQYRDVLPVAEQVIRLEIPGGDADFVAHSIQRTDLAATLLEQVIGLQFGLIAINRKRGTVSLDGFPPVGPGEALVIDRRDPMLQTRASQAG